MTPLAALGIVAGIFVALGLWWRYVLPLLYEALDPLDGEATELERAKEKQS